MVVIIPFKDEDSVKQTLDGNPKLKDYPLQSDIDMETRNKTKSKMVRVGQCQPDTDITSLLGYQRPGRMGGELLQ